MMVKHARYRFVLFSVLLPLLCLILAAKPAEAAVSRWAIWKVAAAFPNNSLSTRLIVQIGHTTTSGKQVIDMESSFPVTCGAVGNPVIQNNEATFNGSSYFTCGVPSIQDKVLSMTNGQFAIPQTCSSKRPLITAVTSINGSPAQASPDNPLFYRSDNNQNVDFSLDLPLNTGTQQAALRTQFGLGQPTAVSGNFGIQTNQVVTAVYQKIANPNTFGPIFTVDTTTLSATPATLNGPFVLSTLESTVYIGYSPTTGKFFEGSLTSLLADPYCTGTG